MIKNACTSAVAESKNAYQQKPATIAILGCGVIGKSWLTAFVSKGHRVRVWDPDPKLEQAIKPLLDEFVDCHVQLCETQGGGCLRGRIYSGKWSRISGCEAGLIPADRPGNGRRLFAGLIQGP